MRLRHRLRVPQCPGVDHMDYTADGRTALVSCEFGGNMVVVDLVHERVLRTIPLRRGAMPQDVKLSPDGRTFYVTNRGEGSITLLSFRTRRPLRKWRRPGGGSPDMGGLSADGRVLWLSGRYNREVYAIDTRTGRLLHRIEVGAGPHGLAVWPQPGRYSIGHTGILR